MIAVSILIAILIWVCALQIWNITTLTRSLSTARGWIRLIAGAAVAFAGLVVLYFAVLPAANEVLSFLSIVTFLTALAVEFLVGDDLREFYERTR